jgi:hypothetical protein
MPRKPTPSLLDTPLPPAPDEELMTPEPVLEVPEPVVEAPAPAIKKKAIKIKKDVESATGKVVEKVDVGQAEAALESAATSLETSVDAAVESAFSPEASEPGASSQHGLVDTLVLAGIGALALALDEGPKLLHKLVERGEQAQSKRAVRMPHLRIHLKKPSKAAEAQAEASPEVPAEKAPGEAESENPEEGEEKDNGSSVIHGPIITLNLFSFGSPVNFAPKRKSPPKAEHA